MTGFIAYTRPLERPGRRGIYLAAGNLLAFPPAVWRHLTGTEPSPLLMSSGPRPVCDLQQELLHAYLLTWPLM